MKEKVQFIVETEILDNLEKYGMANFEEPFAFFAATVQLMLENGILKEDLILAIESLKATRFRKETTKN